MAIRPDQNNKEEFVQLPAGIIPANLNPEFWVARTNDILGSVKIYNTLEELVNLHPNLMQEGMDVTINQHERAEGLFKKTKLSLLIIPELNLFPLTLVPTDTNYFLNFYEIAQEFEATEFATVFEYASDFEGLKPPFPYINNASAESSWSATYNAGESKWLRSRTTNRQFDGSSIYKDWTIPLPINGNFSDGDFTQNLFIRSASAPTLPPAKINGLSNNDPVGYLDVPPVGTDPLYEIRGQKDKFGNLISQWIGPFLILENEELIRYNANAVPNPNTLASTSQNASSGSQANTDLIAAGWVKLFDPTVHKYRARRAESSPGTYTLWNIVQISDESGEYIDRIYKLFPINTDFDSPTFIANNTPTGNDPISNTQEVTRNEGWSDTQLFEGTTTINATSEARKFIDGSLKSPWSSPKVFTGKDSYIDYISSNGEIAFKYANSQDLANNIADPLTIVLTAFLFKGNTEITTGLTYKWFKIYNNKNAIVVNPDTDTPIGTNKSITVSPSDIATKAIFRCYTTLEVSGGDIVFEEEESITDITDGDDAKSLILSSDTPIILFDTGATEFSVNNILLRGFQNFLDASIFNWYKDNGSGVWVSLGTPASPTTNYTLTNQSLTISAANLFASTGTKENARFALSTSNTVQNVESTDEYYDIITIAKLSSAGIGAAGQDALTISLSDELDSATLDRATGLPQAGNIGINGSVFTDLAVYDGTTKLVPNTDYTIALSDTESDIAFASTVVGGNFRVYVNTWTATTVRKVTATITVTVTSVTPNIVVPKNFTVTTSLDDAGALIAFIDIASDSVNKGLSFLPNERNPIKLVARLDQNGTAITSFGGNVIWSFNNATTTTNLSGTNNINKTVNRADVNNNLSVKAQIAYQGKTYLTTPINIDDITDSKQYIAYHRYPGAIPVEPLSIPTKPNNITIAAFNALGVNSLINNNFFPSANGSTYFYSLGLVSNISGTDTIVWDTPIRNRGEQGSQGDTPDFIVTMYQANNTGTEPSITPQEASRTQMLALGWKFTPAETTGDILFSASNTFNGTDVNTQGAAATGNWRATRVSGIPGPAGDGLDGADGNTIEYRYQSSATEEFVTFTNSDRSAGTGWSTTKPSIRDNNYIFETQVYIDPDNAIVGTWSAPILVGINPQILIDNSSIETQYFFTTK